VERDGRHLEGEAGHDEDEAHQHAQLRAADLPDTAAAVSRSASGSKKIVPVKP
jgi:hypothetical protein